VELGDGSVAAFCPALPEKHAEAGMFPDWAGAVLETFCFRTSWGTHETRDRRLFTSAATASKGRPSAEIKGLK